MSREPGRGCHWAAGIAKRKGVTGVRRISFSFSYWPAVIYEKINDPESHAWKPWFRYKWMIRSEAQKQGCSRPPRSLWSVGALWPWETLHDLLSFAAKYWPGDAIVAVFRVGVIVGDFCTYQVHNSHGRTLEGDFLKWKGKMFLFFKVALHALKFPSDVYTIVGFLPCISHNPIWHGYILFRMCLLTHWSRRLSCSVLAKEWSFHLKGFFAYFLAVF